MENNENLNTGRRMQAHVKVADKQDMEHLLQYTNGEYPVSGDKSRVDYSLWNTFKFPTIWNKVSTK